MILARARRAVLIGLIPLLVVVPLIVLWAWMFKEMLKRDDLPSIFKPYWTMACIPLNIPAAIFSCDTVYSNR